MVTWAADGYMSGLQRKALHEAVDTAPLADAAVFDYQSAEFTVAGTVDAEIITRIAETPLYGTIPAAWAVNANLLASGTFTFVSSDFALNPGMDGLGLGLYVIPASEFDEGYIPTPSEIVLFAADNGYVPYTSTPPGVTGAASSIGFSVTVDAFNLTQNTKYWALMIPVAFDGGTFHHALTPYDLNGRALSFWTNRTPEAPIITEPASGTVVTAGRDIRFSYLPNDPDGTVGAPNDYRPWSFADQSGIQVQYAPRPSPGNPDPEWTDLPIASTHLGEDPVLGPGWYIEYQNPFDKYLGVKQLHETRTMMIRCGGTSLEHGYASLPSGNWQLRMRTFDYGHALSTLRRTDTAVPGYGPLGGKGAESPDFVGDSPGMEALAQSWTPDNLPEANVSPWSEPVNLAISTEVPSPVALSPISNNAIVEGGTVTLHWQYRNTHLPSLPQQARQVQIRKRGETEWTTLVSGNNSDHFYSITGMEPDNGPPQPAVTPPYQYLSDLGFEAGTVDSWETNGTDPEDAKLRNRTAADGAVPRSGLRSLRKEFDSGWPGGIDSEYPFRRRVLLRPEDKYISVGGWAKRGPNTTGMNMLIWFLNGAQTQILWTSNFIQFDDADGGWQYLERLDIPVIVGAKYLWIVVNSEIPPVTLDEDDQIDDFFVLGSPTTPVEPDPIPALDIPTQAPIPYPLEATTQYEWRVRVADTKHVTSEWSMPGVFWIVPQPGSGPVIVPGETIEGATLGCGRHTVEIFRRGGQRKVGTLTQVGSVEWGRLRDDISDAKIIVKGWDVDCGNLLASLRTWAYEVVIWRDNGFSKDRVWEGPITLLTYDEDKDQVVINAKDVIVYIYRRIIKQLMNDSGNGDSVVARAARILQNVLAPDDPNVLAYLQAMSTDADPQQYRNLPPWSRTAYEEIDDMAANSGLDYTAVGRAILLWGTKHRIGLLPELRNEHLGSKPIVSEYGMAMANVYGISDGNGVHGEAYRLLLPEDEQTSDEIYGPDGEDEIYGLVEMLSSSWASETEEEAGTYTQEGLETVQRSFSESAERSIDDRYPSPVVVRVPDNTTLHQNTPLSIQNLVPGVSIPVRSTGLRVVRAMQKLDSMKVIEVDGKETITVTLSPFNHEVIADDVGGGDL